MNLHRALGSHGLSATCHRSVQNCPSGANPSLVLGSRPSAVVNCTRGRHPRTPQTNALAINKATTPDVRGAAIPACSGGIS